MRMGFAMRQQAIAAVFAKALRLNSSSIADISAGKVTRPACLAMRMRAPASCSTSPFASPLVASPCASRLKPPGLRWLPEVSCRRRLASRHHASLKPGQWCTLLGIDGAHEAPFVACRL